MMKVFQITILKKMATSVLDAFSNAPIIDGNTLRELGYEIEYNLLESRSHNR